MPSSENEYIAFFLSVIGKISNEPEEDRDDNRAFENSPSFKMAAPLAKYQVLVRLLDERDVAYLQAKGVDVRGQRAMRRKLYLEYVAMLSEDISAIYSERLEVGSASVEDVFRDRGKADACLRRMKRHAFLHKLGMPGMPESVAASLRELRDVLGVSQVVPIRAGA
jgi:hypothetical protein